MLEKDKISLCRIIKNIYIENIISFDNKFENLEKYNESYARIAGLLDGFNATSNDIKRYLGHEIYEWYFAGYDRIVSLLLD